MREPGIGGAGSLRVPSESAGEEESAESQVFDESSSEEHEQAAESVRVRRTTYFSKRKDELTDEQKDGIKGKTSTETRENQANNT